MHIGTKLRLIRRRDRITQQELAERSGIPCGTICGYECGKHEPTYFAVECLLNAMGYRLVIARDKRDNANGKPKNGENI